MDAMLPELAEKAGDAHTIGRRTSCRCKAAGPVTKGAFWEMTAVPDIRRQCEALARHLAKPVKGMPAAAQRPAPARALDFAV